MTGLRWKAPSVSRVVVAWLVPEFGAGNVGLRRPQMADLPYRMVTVVTGNDPLQKVMRCATVSVHTFANSMDAAEEAAGDTDDRMLLMGPPLAGPQQVTITNADSTTSVVVPHSVVCTHIPVWMDYQDDLIFRFYAKYEIDVRFAATS